MFKHRAHREHRGFSEDQQSAYNHPNEISNQIIDACIRIHKAFGPGLLESVYEACLVYELKKAGLKVEVQKPIPIIYESINLDVAFRADLIVEDSVLVELKSIEKITSTHEAQLYTYLKLTKIRLGLLINFNNKLLKDGIKRYVF